jgi:hypothetical protein
LVADAADGDLRAVVHHLIREFRRARRCTNTSPPAFPDGRRARAGADRFPTRAGLRQRAFTSRPT